MDYITINGKRYPVSDFRFPTKPQTNADRIRAMTDEELAKFIASQRTDCYRCPVMECVDACEVSWLDWLKQEASE